MKPLLYALAGVLMIVPAHAAPKMLVIPIGPSYGSYAAARDTASLDGASSKVAREALGLPMSIISTGSKREQEIKNGYATLFATWAQTTLRVPLGWHAVDEKPGIERSLVLSPQKTVRIVARAAFDSQENTRARNAFEKFKLRAVQSTRARLQSEKFQVGELELFDAPNGAFVVRARNLRDASGKTWSFIEHFAQRSTPAARRIWWAKRARNEPLGMLPIPHAMSLLAPAESFEKHLGLLGLMIRDRGLNWAREESLTLDEFVALSPDAKRMVQIADEAVALLRAERVEDYLTRFPGATGGETRAFEATRLRAVTVPFLKRLPSTLPRTEITLTTDADPQEPLFRVAILRQFTVGETGPTYVVFLQRVQNRVLFLGIATTGDDDA